MKITLNQQAVLTSLAGGERSIPDLAYDWPWLSESSARSAVNSLWRRSLVDVAGFDNRARTYAITARGQSVIDAVGGPNE